MFASTASGQMLTPYVVYKAERLQDSWIQNGPIGVYYDRTKSGWFDSSVFYEWFNKVIITYVRSLPVDEWKVVIGDNLPSHLSLNIVKLCTQHKIRMVFLPPNSTAITQPLDVAVYGPLKRTWREVLLEWKMGEGARMTTLPKWCFPKLLLQLLQKLDDRWSNLSKAGFRGCGIYPFDPEHVLQKVRRDDKDKYPPSEYVSPNLLQYLKETREASVRHQQRPRSKRINVEPGKSVTLADLEILSTPRTQPASKKRRRRQESSSSETPDSPDEEEEPDMNQPSTSGTSGTLRQRGEEVYESECSEDDISDLEEEPENEQPKRRKRNDSEECIVKEEREEGSEGEECIVKDKRVEGEEKEKLRNHLGSITAISEFTLGRCS